MQIQQMQASYQADQDRILLRLHASGGHEQQVWLTRRMLKGMLVHLQRLADHLGALGSDETGTNALETVTETRANEHAVPASNSTPSNPPKATDTAPVLTTALHVSPATNSSLSIRFDEVHDGSTVATRSVEVTLGPELLTGLVQLMDAVLRIADWGLRLHAHSTEDTEPSPLDAFDDAPRPKYLN